MNLFGPQIPVINGMKSIWAVVICNGIAGSENTYEWFVVINSVFMSLKCIHLEKIESSWLFWPRVNFEGAMYMVCNASDADRPEAGGKLTISCNHVWPVITGAVLTISRDLSRESLTSSSTLNIWHYTGPKNKKNMISRDQCLLYLVNPIPVNVVHGWWEHSSVHFMVDALTQWSNFSQFGIASHASQSFAIHIFWNDKEVIYITGEF